MGCGAFRGRPYVSLGSEKDGPPALEHSGGKSPYQESQASEARIPDEADALASLHACITMDPSCQALGESLLDELQKQLRLSQSLRKCYGEIQVSTSLLVQGVWSVPQSQAVILLLTPEWLLTPLGAAALRAMCRLRSMQLGPQVLPLIHVNAFPDGPSSALNAPSGQLLREAASPGSWGCLDNNLAAAIPQAAAWAAQRLENLFVQEGIESGEDNTPANLASRRQEATGLTQTTWRRAHASREREPVEAKWQDFPQSDQKSPKRPRNMPSLHGGGGKGRNGEERQNDKSSLRQVAETAARHVDDMNHRRQSLSKLPRRASEPGLHAPHKGLPKTIVKDWADAMRDVLGVPNAEGAFPQGESSSRRGSKEAQPPLPTGASVPPSQPEPSSEKPRRKSQVIPPLPETGIRPASGIVKGECRRQWRVQELTLDDSFEEDLPPYLQAAATVRHWAALALEKRPRTPGRDPDEPQSAPATPHGRDQGWDHFDLQSTGFYLAEAMSPSAMRGIGIGIAAPDPFTGGAALSWEKADDKDPSSSWWGTHPAETQQAWGTGLDESHKKDVQEEADGRGERAAQEPRGEFPSERNPASKVDAMMSLQVELPPLPAGTHGTHDHLLAAGVLPSEKKHIEMNFGSLEMVTQLVHAKGGGSHGPKFIALHQKLNRRVVCWRFVAPKHFELARRSLLQDSVAEEVKHLQTLRHPCICPYFAGEVLEGHLYVVTGYAPGGSVADWLADAGPLAEAPTQRVVRSVLEGLGYLHSHDVAHGAVRGGNVLLGPGAAIRLCDFGLSALREGSVAGSVPKGRANESSALSQSAVPWMAPEVLEGKIPTASSDMWSLGCLVAELALAKPIALGAPFRAAQSAAGPPLLKDELQALHESSRVLAARCMRLDPAERPRASEILEGPETSS